MKVAILVPYRSDGAERTRNWNFLKPLWEETGWPIFEGESPEGKFCRSHALNDASRQAGNWDVALNIDADQMVGNLQQAYDAVEKASRTGSYIAAHSIQHYLTERGTQDVVSGRLSMTKGQQRRPIGLTWEAVSAIPRSLWDLLGGFDERFVGYGGEGLAFFWAASCLRGADRVEGPVYHFEHWEARDPDDPQLAANMNLAERYRKAIDDPAAMRAILAER